MEEPGSNVRRRLSGLLGAIATRNREYTASDLATSNTVEPADTQRLFLVEATFAAIRFRTCCARTSPSCLAW